MAKTSMIVKNNRKPKFEVRAYTTVNQYSVCKAWV